MEQPLYVYTIEEYEDHAQYIVTNTRTGSVTRSERMPVVKAFNMIAVIKNCPLLIEVEKTEDINIGDVG